MAARIAHRLIAGCLAAPWPLTVACAGDLSFGVGYVGEYTDNILHTQADPLEEWTNVVVAGVAYRELGEQLAANAQGRVEYLDYTHQDFRNETLGYFNGAVIWSIVPRRFLWSLTDRLSQLSRIATDPLAPGNREAVNAVETGPDVLFPVTPISTIVLGARAGNVWFREGDQDYNSLSVAARWRQRLSSTATASANAEGWRVGYTEATTSTPSGVQDYTRSDYYLRYDLRSAIARLVMDAGATRVSLEESQEDVGEFLGRLNLAYRLSSDSSFGISYSHELMTVGTALLAGVADPTVAESITTFTAVPVELASGEVFIGRRGEAFYTAARRDLVTQISGFYRDFDYLTAVLDRTETGAVLRLTYNLSATTAVGAWGATLKTEHIDLARLDRDVSYGATLLYRLTPHLSFGVEGTRVDRISSEATADYSETRGIVRLIWSSSTLFSPAAGR